LCRGERYEDTANAGKAPLYYAVKYGNTAVARQLEAKDAKADGVTLFHAGDDANKNLDLSGPFTPEIDYLAGKGESIDFAFVPVRGCGFPELDCARKGIYYSVDKLHPKVLFPVHSSRAEYRYAEFAQDAAKSGCEAKTFCARASGDRYLYRKGKVEEL